MQILDWTKTNVHSSFNICWGAMAAIYHFHGVPKHDLEHKAFGVFNHHNNNIGFTLSSYCAKRTTSSK
ncbi:MAG: hypothetical protein COB83_10705 [Gammaproteobacteria bacterium]|nr:MAG: hypothetical protein COB83_10705 [Gammaproteobacteria bacterium]